MRTSCLFLGALGAVAAACDPEVDGVITSALSRHLTDVPPWSATAPSTGSCFGASVAAADLDGDGHTDLAVADPPCPWHPVTPGRIAIYRGLPEGYFAAAPAWTTLDWQNPPRGGQGMILATGDVDADGRADLLVRASAGVQVFAGIADAGAPLPPPAFRVPGTGAFGAALLDDLDGDGRADLVSARAGTATVWRATPGAQPFTAARAIAGASGLVRTGDTDADGRADLVVVASIGEARLYRGCALGAPDCDGGIGAEPAWTTDRRVYGAAPDVDGDGRAELLLADGVFEAYGRMWLHLSDAATGGFSDAPATATLGDPNYPGFGAVVVRPGDLDGDGHATEIVVAAVGRVYAMFPAPGEPDLRPGFAWPRNNSLQGQLLGDAPVFTWGTLSVAAAGDLDGDGDADLVAGNAPEYDDPRPGRVFVFAGGKRKPITPARPRPYLHGDRSCGAAPGDRPDLTVDAEALARSLYVEHRAFDAGSCELAEGCVAAPGVRRLLRFTTSIANLGGGPVVIPGPESAPHLYHFDACHGHDHLSDFARYELRDRHGGVIATGRKQGFFLLDNAPYCADGAPAADYYPDQGISAGWADVYVAEIPCQWLDVTDVPDGTYTLRIDVDTLGLVDQDDVLPDTAAVRVRLQGDLVRVLD
ncbi:MAG TPA: FG-GAP-like repeat-containing protein [Kofleriaceae bacterium]|nr:FG-GAP-like repeat-containing protein [Kofleriaceae bacterium]